MYNITKGLYRMVQALFYCMLLHLQNNYGTVYVVSHK